MRLVAQMVMWGRALILLPILTKGLGALSYGIWTQVMVSAMFLLPLATLELETACVRYLGSQNAAERVRSLWSSLTVVWAISSAIGLMLLLWDSPLSVALFADAAYAWVVRLLALLLWARVTQAMVLAFHRSLFRFGRYTAIELAQALAELAVLWWVVGMKGGELSAALWVVVGVEGCVAMLLVLGAVLENGWRKPVWVALRRWFSYSIPLIPSTFLVSVVAWGDRYVIAHLLDVRQVGIYSVSYSVASVTAFLLGPLGFVVFPAASRLWGEDKVGDVGSLFGQALRGMLLVSIPAAFGLVTLSPLLIRMLATEEYVVGRSLMGLLVASYAVLGVYQLWVYVIHLGERTRHLVVLFLTVAVANIVLNLILVPVMGIQGAAVATLICVIGQAVTVKVMGRGILRVGLQWTVILKSIVAGGVMAWVVNLVSPHNPVALALSIVLGMVVYVGILALLREVKRDDVVRLGRAFGVR
jgi:O-antigen/teichoic acid export membrane protein